MRKYLSIAATLGLGFALSACGLIGGGTPVACSAESAAQPLVGIVKEQLEKAVAARVKSDDGGRMASLSRIRAAIGELAIGLEDVRTSKEDPNSTKRFCAATLTIKMPADALTDANKARDAAGMGDVSDLADEADVERNADRFSAPIDFEIQPTDDGSKVFAETAGDNRMFAFAAEVLASSLLRASVENAEREQRQSQAAATAAEQAALSEQRDATLASARVDNQLATQTINAMWKALGTDTRQRLLPLQRAWVRKKEADCRVEAAQTSTDPTEIEAARMGCDTRVTQERVGWLGQYRNEEPMMGPGSSGFDEDMNETDAML